MNEHKPVYSRHRFPKQIKTGTCRGCHQPITAPRRTTWCSDECKKLYDPYWVKIAVVKRDRHICQMCGIDIQAAILAWRRAKPSGQYDHCFSDAFKAWRKARVIEEHDHIIPFSEGGATVLDNMRTLCSVCHKKRTAEWRSARKAILNT